ncbi:MAG TPA: ABC-type transport auxiliary lipoprotein family protein [Stellaceae bacterium]|nr:ABC-type transport auxiliary lipoprotein family protein [Stellaceae bacterium]
MMPLPRFPRRAAALATMLALGACSSLFGGPPENLYRLASRHSFPASLPRRDVRLVVDVPGASPGLDTTRIALIRPPVSFDYFADSAWTARAPLVVHAALLESFENSRRLTVLDRDSFEAGSDFVLRTELRHFEAEYDSAAAPPQARVAIRVRLVSAGERRIVAEAAFAGREKAAANDVPHVVAALNDALGGVIDEIVAWTLANPALSAARR